MRTPGAVPASGLPTLKVLLVESDDAVAPMVLDALSQAGFTTAWASTGAEGIALKDSVRPHVMLLDLTLPDMNGTALLTRLAEQRDCGLIVISDMNDEADRIVGLELGADDYIAKPLRLRELVARIRAVHRRVNGNGELRDTTQPTQVLKVGPIRINVLQRTVHADDGCSVALTGAEFNALATLAAAAGTAVSRDKLSEAALRRPWRPEDRSVDQLVFNLRQKLPRDEVGGMLIQSIRGSGYWLRAPEGAAQPSDAGQNRVAA